MRRYMCMRLLVVIVVTGLIRAATAQRPPEGQLILGMDFTIVPTFLDPSEMTGATAAIFAYALHDALLKPLPGNALAPALAVSWTESPDGLVYDFTLREGVTFHNGAPFTADDVQYSFVRYKGVFAALLHQKVQAVEILDAHHLRFVLHTPWPDFLTIYGALVSGAAWVVPKAYVERVGDAGFKQHPIGLGPYRLVRATPGADLVLEAYDRYWGTPPTIHRLLFTSVPEPTTRLAMLQTGELDMATLPPDVAAAIPGHPPLRLVHAPTGITTWLEVLDQWEPTSPWHDRRVRLAVNLALDKQAINEVAGLGLDRPTGSIIPRVLEFALPLEPFPYDPGEAQRLLADAGYPQGFDAGDLTPFPPILHVAAAVSNYLGAIGIRTHVRTMERAAFVQAWREKKLRGLVLADAPRLGNAAIRIEQYVLGTGIAYGSSPDLEALFQQQAVARDRPTREALLQQVQARMHERVMHAPLLERAVLYGVGPRVAEPAIGHIPLLTFAAPYEEMRLK